MKKTLRHENGSITTEAIVCLLPAIGIAFFAIYLIAGGLRFRLKEYQNFMEVRSSLSGRRGFPASFSPPIHSNPDHKS